MHTRQSEEEGFSTAVYPHFVKSILAISQNSFVIHEDETNNIRLLTVEYSGTDKYEEKLVYRENSQEIIKILASKNNLYIMTQNGL